MTPIKVYNQLVAHHIFHGYSMRQSNMFAIRQTWYYYNNKIKLKELMKDIT